MQAGNKGNAAKSVSWHNGPINSTRRIVKATGAEMIDLLFHPANKCPAIVDPNAVDA